MEATMVKRSVTTSAPRERVWKAITNPRNFSKWMIQTEWNALEVGEPIQFEGEAIGSIAVVTPIERFAYRWQVHADHPAQTLVTFDLDEIPEGTRITVTEEGFEALPEPTRSKQMGDNTQGWEGVLDAILEDMDVQ